jgi:hypothetical protein
VEGNGSIAVPGGQAEFSMAIKRTKKGINGPFSYRDRVRGFNFTASKFSSFVITGNQARFRGTAKIGKRSVTFTVDVVDNGNPGTLDTFSIQLSDGYSASGNLTNGNIRIY